MRVSSFRSMRVLGSLVVLGLLLAGTWPGSAQGLDVQIEQFREQRLHAKHLVPLAPTALAGAESTPEGLFHWSIVTLDNGNEPSLASDSQGRPHVVYDSGIGLKYAYFDGSVWQYVTVDNVWVRSLCLALDFQGHPHIGYITTADGGLLKYAYYDGASWQVQIVDSGLGNYSGGVSVAVDSTAHPGIGYHDRERQQVKYAYGDGISWQVMMVAGYYGSGGVTSLVFDATNQPHMSFVDGFNADLEYARYVNGHWQKQKIANGPLSDVGVSLALDANNRPHVTYNEQTSWSVLRYARNTGSAWEIETIPNFVRVGGGTTLVFDSAGRPHVSYQDTEHSYIKYAYKDAGRWWGMPVTPGTASSMALDASGQPHIACGGAGGVQYATPGFRLVDQARLAFVSYRDNNWEIYAARGDGSYPVRLTNVGAADFDPEFNRGGTQIAFDSARDGNYEIYKMNADGSGLVRMTWTSYSEYFPTWSPDGSKIAFFGYPDTETNGEIYVINSDGSALTRLTWDPSWDGHPTWSPDGTKIAFVSNRGGTYELWVVNADGTSPQQITFGINWAAYPDWSPDGARFALNDDYNNNGWFDLAIVNADGTGLIHPIGSPPLMYNDYLAPVWSPTGEDIAFADVQYIEYGGVFYITEGNLYGLDLASNSLYALGDSERDFWPDWQPTDPWPPDSQVEGLSSWSPDSFPVYWSGSDGSGIGLLSYDVQYRDGVGEWTDWLTSTTETLATFTGGQDGHAYFFRCRARDSVYNVEPYPEEPDSWTTVDTLPPSSAALSPAYAVEPAFVVTWSGHDTGSGISTYDVQYRDSAGTWTDWLSQTTATSAVFVGELGHVYYFQCRARDQMGYLESYPGGDGDTWTHVPQHALSGYVLNTQEEPVAIALVAAIPPLSNTAYSRIDGSFALYGDVSGTYALDVTRSGFATLPPMQGVEVPGGAPTFYLPPLDDAISDGGFEAGDLAAWELAGLVPVVPTSTAHTGDQGVAFGGAVPAPLVTPTMAFTASAVVTTAGGVLTSSLAVLTIPTGTVSGTAVFTLTGVPTVTGLPTGTQDLGLHLAWQAALTDGTPLTATLRSVTLTASYEDPWWQAAQVAGEETLDLWSYDPVSGTWAPLSGTLDAVSNTVTVTATCPGLLALLGVPYTGPWTAEISQEVMLTPTLATATLSLLYQVVGSMPSTATLAVYVSGPSATVTYTLPLTESGWLHRWWEVPPSLGPTLTIRLLWEQSVRTTTAWAVVDEVSLGTTAAGGYAIYLPILLR